MRFMRSWNSSLITIKYMLGISQMKHQIDAKLCRFYFCRVTLHVSSASAHHQEYLKLVQRPLLHVLSLQVTHHISLLGPKLRRCDDWPATITHVPVAALLFLNTPDDGRHNFTFQYTRLTLYYSLHGCFLIEPQNLLHRTTHTSRCWH